MGQNGKRNQKSKPSKPALAPKYRARRMLLALLTVLIVGGLAWWVLPFGEAEPVDDTVEDDTPEQPATPVVAPQVKAPSESEKESESEDESENEPEVLSTDSPSGDWSLLLVNAATPLPDNFSVSLETVSDGYQVDARIADSVRRMFNQARMDGIDLMICSAYRSVEKQQQNYNNKVQSYLDQGRTAEEADALTVAYIALPGQSEHHTGLAIDIVTPSYQKLDAGYADTPAAKWLLQNAAEYGFILRYPKNKENITQINFEPWHYRYVGREHAIAIMAAGDCLEEYIYATTLSYQNDTEEPDEDDETTSADE